MSTSSWTATPTTDTLGCSGCCPGRRNSGRSLSYLEKEGKEGQREGGREGRKEGAREGRRERWKEGGRERTLGGSL